MSELLDYDLRLDTIHSGFDGQTCWVHARAGAIPGVSPTVVLTMQKLLLTGSDVFYALHEMRTDDLGQTWTGPRPHGETLGRRRERGGIEVCVCDFTPQWHAASGVLLGTGHSARYLGDRLMPDPRPRETAYSIYHPADCTWEPWRTLDMPGEAHFSSGAGCTQRVDLPNGDILLPIYFKGRNESISRVVVTRCTFDGRVLRCVETGNMLALDTARGLGEPSLTLFRCRYYLTLRHDQAGYVAVGNDGLHFGDPQPWTFDDGSSLGNYNTQQHWITHSDGLYLAYTRRGANNDHVFRHRAPLFVGRVDPDRCCVLRDTERVVVPERGARLGNFGVCNVNQGETWIIAAEWMQPLGCEHYGSNNSVFAARILWSRPNLLMRPESTLA